MSKKKKKKTFHKLQRKLLRIFQKKDKKSKKKKSNVDFIFGQAMTPQESLSIKLKALWEEMEQEREYKERMKSILDERFRKRNIPKADEGFRRNDLSDEALKQFYIDANVGEFLKAEGKFIHFEFGEWLEDYAVNVGEDGENQLIKRISYAEISKQSFINNINLSLRYINYFIEYFDDDDELLNAYFQIMFMLHYKNLKMTVDDFVNHVLVWFATDSMFEKVIRMVEYNTDETLIKKSERVYDESIQLTIEHLKAIMGVSCFHRFVIPVVSHFYTIRGKGQLGGITDKDLYFRIFSSFIPMFDDFYGISLYSKIYHTATTRISKTENQENTMWKRRERFGVTTMSFTNDLMREYINEISQKTMFNQSAIVFLHVCFDKAIKNELLKSDKYEMSDMRMEPSDNVNETISRFDRWMMDRTHHNEKDRLRAYVSIKDSVQRNGLSVGINFQLAEEYRTDKMRLEKSYPNIDDLRKALRKQYPEVYGDVDFNYLEDIINEYDYYTENVKTPLHDTQLYIIQLYFASKVSSSDEIKLLEMPDIIRFIMIMKRDLEKRNFVYLPFFISSELITTSAKKITKKSLERVFKDHPSYGDFCDNYKDTFELLNMDKLIGEMQVIVSTPLRIVDYKYIENRGNILNPSDIIVTNEFMRLLIDC